MILSTKNHLFLHLKKKKNYCCTGTGREFYFFSSLIIITFYIFSDRRHTQIWVSLSITEKKWNMMWISKTNNFIPPWTKISCKCVFRLFRQKQLVYGDQKYNDLSKKNNKKTNLVVKGGNHIKFSILAYITTKKIFLKNSLFSCPSFESIPVRIVPSLFFLY